MSMVSAERFAPGGGEAIARLRHVFKVYRIGDTGIVALGGVNLARRTSMHGFAWSR